MDFNGSTNFMQNLLLICIGCSFLGEIAKIFRRFSEISVIKEKNEKYCLQTWKVSM